MSFEAMNWAFNQNDLASNVKFILVILADTADQDGETYVSQSYIARKAGLTRQNVNVALAKLQKSGLISVRPRKDANGGTLSSLYRLNMPGLEDAQ